MQSGILETWKPSEIISLVAAVTGIVSLFASLLISKRSLAASRAATDASIWQKANETEMVTIRDQLAFYMRYMEFSEFNGLLASDLRARQPDAETFLLLEKLFDNDWLAHLSPGDHAIVAEIAANAGALSELIRSKSGNASQALRPYFARVLAHYRILQMAYDRKLGTDPRPFVERYVFPKQINRVLELEVSRLEARLAVLRATPAHAPPPMNELNIPDAAQLKQWVQAPRTPRPELNMPVS